MSHFSTGYYTVTVFNRPLYTDGVLDPDDNCPYIANSNQADTDGDGIGDVCDNNDLLRNGGFEVDLNGDGAPDSWIMGQPYTLDSAVKHDGTYAVKITVDATNTGASRQAVQLQANTTYTLRVWIKTEGCGNGSGGKGAQVYYYDDGIGTKYVTATLTKDWQLYSILFTTGSNTNNGRVSFRVKGGGTAWFDSMILAPGTL